MSTAIHILWTDPQEEIRREAIGERFCFACRKRRVFERVVMAPVGMSYYGPMRKIVCTACEVVNGDLFPGRELELA